ncbi:exonuclease domain-containing protein [Saprospiraceae bacterium]|nr:exonuclease domain-containing protein [Saprospiraceae bacterium]
MAQKYAVVDLETTGGIPKRDKITEVAIIIYDGKDIIGEYQSLINPERTIPPHITRITGITNEMVEDAPKFYEIAKNIIETIGDAIFVAHNVRFDYQFLKEEFSSLGFTFTKRKLCSVKLSRKAFPGLKSYALGNLIKYFKIDVANRHRAYDDAWATTIILGKILAIDSDDASRKLLVTEGIKLTQLPDALTPDDIKALPNQCGVYYFSDVNGILIYIGKSLNIRSRVKQHFSKHNSKSNKLLRKVHDISYELTGNELASLVLESYEIKKEMPEINKAQKRRDYAYAVIKDADKSGYSKYKIVKANKTEAALSYYSSRKSAIAHIEQITEAYGLCHKINGNEKAETSCFNYGIDKCTGACIGMEFPLTYNERFENSLLSMNRVFEENMVIIEKGRELSEKCVFLIEDGHYQGHGYIDIESMQYGIEELKESVQYRKMNPEADTIIRNYLWSHPNITVERF